MVGMALKIKPSPINIVPFVDVLLVLFVILVVAARFDGLGKEEISKLNMLIQEQKNKIALLSEKKPVTPALPTTKIVKKVISAPTVVKIETKIIEDVSKIDALNSRITDLEDQLKKAKNAVTRMDTKGGGTSANIVFGIDDKITVNGILVSEDFIYTLLKSTHPELNIGWKGRGHETAYRFEEFAKTLGYNMKGD
jgi:biopolymer transport protein ExbD